MTDTPERPRSGRIVEAVTEGGELLADSMRPAVDRVRPVIDRVRTDARRRLSRHRRRRRRAPLPNLYEVHPAAKGAAVRELGLVTVPLDEVVGTAVEGPHQRGLDFKPLQPFRSSNWNGRWMRILDATRWMETLPPIDVLRTADGYWVTDGHNRVAAAKVNGQLEIDAVVRAVMLPGEPVELPPGPLAPVLAESDQVVAAGRGLLTPGATLGYEGVAHATGDPDDREAPDHSHHAGGSAHGAPEERA